MSNDVVPDWAITTSAHLKKEGIARWRKEVDGSGAEEMAEGPNAGNSTVMPNL